MVVLVKTVKINHFPNEISARSKGSKTLLFCQGKRHFKLDRSSDGNLTQPRQPLVCTHLVNFLEIFNKIMDPTEKVVQNGVQKVVQMGAPPFVEARVQNRLGRNKKVLKNNSKMSRDIYHPVLDISHMCVLEV